VRLKVPDLEIVGLQADDLLDGGFELVPVFEFFVFVGFVPEISHGDGTHAERGEFHGRRGGIDLAELGGREAIFGAHPRERAAGGTDGFIAAVPHARERGWLAQARKRNEQQRDGRDIGNFANERLVLDHPAISRDLRKKYAAMVAQPAYTAARVIC
jgi:hypothetical protein